MQKLSGIAILNIIFVLLLSMTASIFSSDGDVECPECEYRDPNTNLCLPIPDLPSSEMSTGQWYDCCSKKRMAWAEICCEGKAYLQNPKKKCCGSGEYQRLAIKFLICRRECKNDYKMETEKIDAEEKKRKKEITEFYEKAHSELSRQKTARLKNCQDKDPNLSEIYAACFALVQTWFSAAEKNLNISEVTQILYETNSARMARTRAWHELVYCLKACEDPIELCYDQYGSLL